MPIETAMTSDTDAGNRAEKVLLNVRKVVTSNTEPSFNYGYQNSPGSAEIVELPFHDREKRIPRGLDPIEG